MRFLPARDRLMKRSSNLIRPMLYASPGARRAMFHNEARCARFNPYRSAVYRNRAQGLNPRLSCCDGRVGPGFGTSAAESCAGRGEGARGKEHRWQLFLSERVVAPICAPSDLHRYDTNATTGERSAPVNPRPGAFRERPGGRRCRRTAQRVDVAPALAGRDLAADWRSAEWWCRSRW